MVPRIPHRFTPTGVGNIRKTGTLERKGSVHPHGCGEHLWILSSLFISSGSSPRVWGTFNLRQCLVRLRRFIPTGVGNIVSPTMGRSGCTVHPHGCGEHLFLFRFSHNSPGSSPRVWGTSIDKWDQRVKRRFIPTGVGNISHPG